MTAQPLDVSTAAGIDQVYHPHFPAARSAAPMSESEIRLAERDGDTRRQ